MNSNKCRPVFLPSIHEGLAGYLALTAVSSYNVRLSPVLLQSCLPMQPMLNMALRAARAAGEIIAQSAEKVDLVDVESKGLNDYVTKVDRAAEKAILNVLQKTYPDHGFLGEESGLTPGRKEGADWLWIIDPLDGTTNFIHGFPQFAVSIAVQYKGVTEHGVVLDPIKREEFTGSRGRGAAMNGRRLRVTARKSLEGGLIGTGFPFRPDQHANMDNYLGMFSDVAKQTAGIRRAGAASLDLAYVAAGRLDGFFEFGLQPWDVAAGDLLIREAGGLVSDFTGGHQYLTSGNVVAGNPKLLKSLLTTLAPHLNDSLRR